MAGSVNKVILIGHLGKDPELRVTQEGLKIANLSIATSEAWKDKQTGERKEKTEWHKIVIMNEQLAHIAEKYLTKGSKVYLEGQLQTRKWVDQAGQEKYTTEIILGKFRGELTLLDSRQGNFGNEETAYSAPHNPFQSSHHPSQKETKQKIDLDDEIPF